MRTRARNMLLQDWVADAPTPPYYDFPASLSPHPFMGLGKFLARRIHQMRAGKSYLAAHTSWFDENPEPTCPRCGTEPETFTHAILTCPARKRSSRPPAERRLFPRARPRPMDRPPPRTSLRRIHLRHENRLPPRHDPRVLPPPPSPCSPLDPNCVRVKQELCIFLVWPSLVRILYL